MILELGKSKTSLSSVNKTDPIVLCAADDNYAKPLAVMLHSAATNLRVGNHLNIVLMDGGISESSWVGLRETLLDLPITIHVLQPDRDEISDLGTSHHITHTAYFRLLAARLLPDSIDKVIYLDSDVLVKDDLMELWDMQLEGNYCLAAIDTLVPSLMLTPLRKSIRRKRRTNRSNLRSHISLRSLRFPIGESCRSMDRLIISTAASWCLTWPDGERNRLTKNYWLVCATTPSMSGAGTNTH